MFQTKSEKLKISLLSLLFPLSLPLFLFSTPLSLSGYNTRDCNTLKECLWLLGNQPLGNRKLSSLEFLSLQSLHFLSLWNKVSSSDLITSALSAWIPFQSAVNILWISSSRSDPNGVTASESELQVATKAWPPSASCRCVHAHSGRTWITMASCTQTRTDSCMQATSCNGPRSQWAERPEFAGSR